MPTIRSSHTAKRECPECNTWSWSHLLVSHSLDIGKHMRWLNVYSKSSARHDHVYESFACILILVSICAGWTCTAGPQRVMTTLNREPPSEAPQTTACPTAATESRQCVMTSFQDALAGWSKRRYGL